MSELIQNPKLLGTVIITAMVIGGLSGYMASYLASDTETGDVTFTLVAQLSGFEGEGGEIDGIVNPVLQVQPNTDVTIILRSGENLIHDLAIDGLGVDTDYVAQNNDNYEEELTVTFTVPEGEFVYYCTVAGHRSTMEGQIVGGELSTPDPAKPVDVESIMRDPFDTGNKVAGRTTVTDLHYTLISEEVTAEIEPGVTFDYWTYNSTVPGPLVRGMVGDNITIELINPVSSTQNHSIDFHAVTGPGGGAAVLTAAPGESATFSFVAKHEGTFIYHCATSHIPTHISKGMYGAIVIEPVGGLNETDVELFIGQSDIYTEFPAGTAGHNTFDSEALYQEEPNYVLFNGAFAGFTGDNAINVTQNDTVRIFFGVGGPNLISSFHMIGEIWDKVWYETNYSSGQPMYSAETVLVAPGSALMIELDMEVLGSYFLVDHALSRAIDKGAFGIINVNP